MAIISVRRYVVVAVVAWTASCASGKPAAKDSVAVASSVVEQHQLDLDGDAKPDEIVVARADTSHPGTTARIELRLSRAGARVLEDTARWDPAPEEFNGYGNLVKSRLVYVADFERAGRLLLLFGAKHGCCQQSLTIQRIGPNGLEPYFHVPEIWIDRSPVPLPGKVALLAGRKLSEAVAPPSSEFVSAVTYAPVVVYRFEETVRVASAATQALTREQLGGFAGFAYRTDVAAVSRKNGSKALWNLREHRLVP
jgi:hypothetical protein